MNPVIYWNDVLLEVTRRDHTLGFGRTVDNAEKTLHGGPTRTSRVMAIVSLAIREAVSAAHNPGSSYLTEKTGQALPGVTVPGLPHAIAGAAHAALSKLYPLRFDAFLEEALINALGAPASGADFAAGVQIGTDLCELRKDDRLDDGLYTPDYTRTPGRHQFDPFHRTQGYLNAQWGDLPRFGADATHQPLAPPPSLTHQDYLKDEAEVAEYGVAASTVRTEDQTEIGVFWGYDGANGLGVPPRLYNQIARRLMIAQTPVPTLQEMAEVLAELNVAMADAAIDAWYWKYAYNFWRPVAGLNQPYGGRNWAPLGIPRTNDVTPAALDPLTPNFPAYPSGHATFGAAAFQVLRRRLLGKTAISLSDVLAVQDEVDAGHQPSSETGEMFEFVSDELNGLSLNPGPRGAPRRYAPRHFQSYAHAIYENAASRVYLGVHWLFDGMPRSSGSPAYGGVPLGLAVGDDTHAYFDALNAVMAPAE